MLFFIESFKRFKHFAETPEPFEEEDEMEVEADAKQADSPRRNKADPVEETAAVVIQKSKQLWLTLLEDQTITKNVTLEQVSEGTQSGKSSETS